VGKNIETQQSHNTEDTHYFPLQQQNTWPSLSDFSGQCEPYTNNTAITTFPHFDY